MRNTSGAMICTLIKDSNYTCTMADAVRSLRSSKTCFQSNLEATKNLVTSSG